MGMLSDCRALAKRAKVVSTTTDVGARLAVAQSQMAAADAAMGQSLSGRARTQGMAAIATLSGVRFTGTFVGTSALYQLELLVMLPGRPPVAVSHAELIELAWLPLAVPGRTVDVRVMPGDPTDICVMWAY